MGQWNFKKEGDNVEGANTQMQYKVGGQPSSQENVLADKRNVILTEKGWVRRESYTDTHGNPRVKEEVLVAANPGGGLSYSSNAHASNPDVAQVYVDPNIESGAGANLYVVFNTPVTFVAGAGANNLTITVANTASGNHQVFTCVSGVDTTVLNANNTLRFTGSPTAGDYQVNAQSISVTGGGNPLYNPDQDTTHAANLTISGAASNGLTTFTVV